MVDNNSSDKEYFQVYFVLKTEKCPSLSTFYFTYKMYPCDHGSKWRTEHLW